MAPIIKNVVVAGASGNLGSEAVKALIESGFNVTVLSRSSNKSFPSNVAVKVVDFNSVDSLSAAFEGQDAVVDTTFSFEPQTGINLIDAAAAKGVYRFITSDFGLDPDNPGVAEMPVFGRKQDSYNHVKKIAAEGKMTYSLVACGCFFDLCLENSTYSGIDLKHKSADLFDAGDNVFPWTTLPDVAKAISGVLKHPEETQNRPVYVHGVYLSQLDIIEEAKNIVGKDGWTITNKAMQPLLDQSFAELKSGNITETTFLVQIVYCLAKKELAQPWSKDDNALVGIREMTSREIQDVIRKIVQK
ncbi:putative isoflavone reductase family protein CipA [Fusarium tricinctum]|uniref:Isoflavone reductase family protein CipA n=1 Tax=Fusarium tricinctum TaxID=61284 RepID=A0A8K0RZ41_9HYPO|nr:putative isoflavone reductase family protein CipA [Fusarium tricinctum]